MKTEDLEKLYGLVTESLKKAAFTQYDAEDKIVSRIEALSTLNKIKTEKQYNAFFIGKPFIYKLDDATWFGFTVKDREKTINGSFITNAAAVIMHRIYTSFGYVYYVESPHNAKGKIVTLTSHFFDRYKERLNFKSKDAAIRAFMKDISVNDIQAKIKQIKNSKRRLSSFVSFDIGIGLGLAMDNVMTLKTFVSDDLLRDKQTIDKALLKEMADNREVIDEYLKEKNKT